MSYVTMSFTMMTLLVMENALLKLFEEDDGEETSDTQKLFDLVCLTGLGGFWVIVHLMY